MEGAVGDELEFADEVTLGEAYNIASHTNKAYRNNARPEHRYCQLQRQRISDAMH